MYYDQKKCGKRIQDMRNSIGLTQDQLAEKLNIATSTLGEYGGVFEPLSSDFFAPVIYVKINWSSRSKLRHYVYLTLKVLPLKNPV